MAENQGVWRSIADRDDVDVRIARPLSEVGGGVMHRRDGEV